MIRPTGSPTDLSPLRARMGALFGLRLILAAAVLTTVVAAPATLAGRPRAALIIVAVYLLTAIGGELLRQWRSRVPTGLIGAGILLDGAFIAGVLTLAGGPASGLGFLLYMHLVAVTLLASYRTGLKIAVWQSLLLVVAHYLPPSWTGVAPLAVSVTAAAIVGFLAVALTTALCSALNERALRRSRSGFKALADMAAALEDVQNPEEIGTVLLHAVSDAFDIRRGALLLQAPGTMTVLSDRRVTTSAVDALRPDAVVAQSWHERRPVLRKVLDARWDPTSTAALPGARNVIVVPFLADGEPAGALVVEHRRQGRPGVPASAVALLTQFTVHAALVHRNVRLLAEVKHLATVDGLTGLSNRRTFEDTLHREVARALRGGEDLSLLLLDVDHFKQVNDHHGHPMGDEVLRHVGRVLAGGGRGFDVPARYGGEEFVVVLPGCPPEEAVRVAERLRAGISGPDAPLPVTASVGVAAMHRDAVDAAGLITAADGALYDAKASGRDRVVTAGRQRQAAVA